MERAGPEFGHFGGGWRQSRHGGTGRGQLLLALPEAVCTDDDCIHIPVMRYGDAAGNEADTQGSEEGSRRFPFAGLKEAIRASDQDQD